ncbi:FtsK/SpoIIIE domain-containing protein [Microbacterium karelineae]|uniref:FtsK/SpoIIIE domain-containing protein n=1 Tax=Microbacterium karelineae TaxID=2654283 RepID=UPI0012E9A6CE|nr:FtsK/SpoIIIE domain-containing protein [Microbacterium karelineae]
MSVRVTLGAGGAEERSWLLDVDEATTLGEVAESLDVAPQALVPAAAPDTVLAQSGLLSGAVIPPRDLSEEVAGTVRIEIIGGPFAGATVPLARGGQIALGSGEQADLRIIDPSLAPVHLGIHIAAGEPDAPLLAMLTPIGDAEVLVNGTRVTEPERIVPADLVQIGSVVLRIGMAPVSDADLTETVGGRGFNRPSRILPSKPQPLIALPGDKPDDQDQSPLPWLSAVIPVVLGVTMAIVFSRPIMLMMAAASPIMVIGSFLTQRRLAKKKGLKTEQQWIDEINRAGERIRELVTRQRLEAWFRLPDPVVIRDIALRPLARLWERRRADADAATLRVGVTEIALDVNFEGGGSDRSADRRVGVSPAPVGMDLRQGVAGIAGPSDAVRALARSIVTSFATLRSPRESELIVLCDDGGDVEWGWASWLPHTHMGDSIPAMIGNDDDTRRERLREISVALDLRMRMKGQRGYAPPTEVLVVVDGARRLRMLPGMVPLLEHGPAHGIHVLALDSDRARLPEEAKNVVVVDGDDPALATLETPTAYFSSVLLDGTSVPQAERIARSLCSIQHVSGVGDEALLPTSVRMVDLLGIDLEDPSPLVRRWTASPRNTYVVVGANADGEFAVDISRDGPHALVAGTTGSGKSEFLQALVVGLAMANRPDALNFVLIDYKGGSAFADCERLPHTVGMVTNLDARETERALASLDAELKRREQVLRDMGAKDLDAAWARDPEGAAQRGLARLMLVIDEFAELKTELPAFIDGLVRIARVGRSLGVNLVLATQRPAGVVTPEMQSNINLRVALRVTDRSDSSDIIGSAEAALISPSTPGRGYVRAGSSSSPEAFQTARVAGIRPGAKRDVKVLPPKAPIEWDLLGFPPRFPPAQKQAENSDHDDTDLRALVDLVTAATDELGIQKNPSPWLMPLPAVLPLDRFDAEPRADGEIVLGLEDVPAYQAQRTLTWNAFSGSHLMFMGGALSGRTSALRVLLAQVVSRFAPEDVHLYVCDFGNGALLPLADAPHCGAVVTPLDGERLPRLMQRVLDDLAHRQSVISAAGVGNIGEQRRAAGPGEALPYAVIAIDGWERMLSTMNPDQLLTFRDQVMRVLREGPAVGVRVLVTGDQGVVGDKIATFIDTQYVLPVRDVADYRTAGIHAKDVPDDLPAGRTLFGSDAKEAQLAVLGRDTSGEAQTTALRRVVEDVLDQHDQRVADAGGVVPVPVPFRVDPLPRFLAMSAARELPVAEGCAPDGLVVAVGGDRLSQYTLDWPMDGGFIVSGGRQTGRSSTLAALLDQLVARGSATLVVALRPSILTERAEAAGVRVLGSDALAWGPMEIASALPDADGRTLSIVVDDVEQLKNSPLDATLASLKDRARFLCAVDIEMTATLFGGPFAEAKRARRAVVLRPGASLHGTQVTGTPIPKFMLGATPAGGGVFAASHGWMPARVPDLRE